MKTILAILVCIVGGCVTTGVNYHVDVVANPADGKEIRAGISGTFGGGK